MSALDLRENTCEAPHGPDDPLEMPSLLTIERLIRWHDKRAALDGRLALSLEAEGLATAAETNRQRALAHRQTATCLKVLRQRCCALAPTPAEFRGHLKPKPRPRAEVRAPP